MPRKADIGDMEKRMLDATLPYGISCFRFMRIGDENNINDDRRAYERNQKKGFIDYTKRDYKSKETKRFQITPTGISKTLEKIIPSHILECMDTSNNYRTYGNIRNEDTRARLTTLGDIQCYLYTMGVIDVYHAVADYYLDPFVFGYPQVDLGLNQEDANTSATSAHSDYIADSNKRDSAPKCFYDGLMAATVNAAKQCMPVTDESLIHCLFIANRQNPAVPVPNKSNKPSQYENGNYAKRYNNASGIILDLMNKNAYVVFKTNANRKFSWHPAAYENMLYGCSETIGELGIKNVKYGTTVINAAMILCETRGAALKRVSQVVSELSFAEPFYHVFIVVMQESQGQEFLDGIFNEGMRKYLERSKEIAFEGIEGLRTSQSAIDETAHKRISDGAVFEDGTILDLCVINRIKGKQDVSHEPFRVVCYESQLELYRDYAGILEENIITIPDP